MGAVWSWYSGVSCEVENVDDVDVLVQTIWTCPPKTAEELTKVIAKYEQLRSRLMESRLDVLHCRLAELELEFLKLKKFSNHVERESDVEIQENV